MAKAFKKAASGRVKSEMIDMGQQRGGSLASLAKATDEHRKGQKKAAMPMSKGRKMASKPPKKKTSSKK